MFLIRKRPQPRGFCSPSSFASRSGVSASGISRLAAVVGDAHDAARRSAAGRDLDRQLGR